MRYLTIIFGVVLSLFSSCNKYLDVVPDNIATIDMAFRMRVTAEQYLFTCYSYLPNFSHVASNPALYGADESWRYDNSYPGVQIARGSQSIVQPILDRWSGYTSASMSAATTGSLEGTVSTTSLWRGIRDCNIFMENIDLVKDMDQSEKDRWIAEVKVLKAFYHFYLLRMYGPIPLIRENLPISSGVDEVQVAREPFDDCVDYIVQLLDEAAAEENLPITIEDRTTELGRITKSITLSIKALVLVTAASPLFNGNVDYEGFVDKNGLTLFNTVYDPEKWSRAAVACKDAIDLCHTAGHKLYTYSLDARSSQVSTDTYYKMNIRGSVTARENPEVIWPDVGRSTTTLQRESQARLDAGTANASTVSRGMAPTLKMAESFYTINGVPITEDKTWDYAGRYSLRVATDAERNYIQPNYTTASLHYDREPRFYGSLAFDGSVWFGQGNFTESAPWYVMAKLGQYSGGASANRYSVTGYWPKKLVNPASTYAASVAYVVVQYHWPIIRLADLYLLYAEALNELDGPGEEAYHYINLVREKAGLATLQESWENYSTDPGKYLSQAGLRQIIHQERTIELAFEGHRFWDLRRWKRAMDELNKPVYGWDVSQRETDLYYRIRELYRQEFRTRDYLWPLRELDVIVNENLVQNPGW